MKRNLGLTLFKSKTSRLSSYWRDIITLTSGNAIAQLVGFIGLPILTRLYSPAEFAIQALFIQAAMYASGVVAWRYDYMIQLPESNSDAGALHKLVVFSGLVVTIGLTIIFSYWGTLVSDLLGSKDLAPWLLYVPITAFLISYATATQNMAQRNLHYKASAQSELLGKVAYIGSGLIGKILHPGALGLIAAPASSAVIKILVLHCLSERLSQNKTKFNLKHSLRVGRRYIKLANSMVVSHILMNTTGAIPLVAIAQIYGKDILGQYSLVMATIFLPTGLIGSAIGQVYYQRAARKWSTKIEILSLWKETVGKLLIFGVPIFVVAYFLAPNAYPLIFGDNWTQAGEMASYFAIAAFLSFISSPVDRTCLIVGAWWYPIAWHSFRILSTICVVALSIKLNLNAEEFIEILIAQICVAYVIDFLMEYKFARLTFKGVA